MAKSSKPENKVGGVSSASASGQPSPAENKACVEHELAALRDQSRLAIHMNEEFTYQIFSKKTWKWFATRAENFKALVESSRDEIQALPFISMSLLPRKGVAVFPFCDNPNLFGVEYGYLIDLSQDRPDRTMLAGFFNNQHASGYEAKRKIFWGYTRGFMPHDMRDQFADSAAWCQAVAGKQGPDLCNLMLDKMATEIQAGEGDTRPFNEIIGAVNHCHIKAIVVPVQSKGVVHAKLEAAIAGLGHLAQEPPIDLPVVLYQVGKREDIASGDIIYVGRGRAELLKVVLDCVKEYQEAREDCPFVSFISHLSGINTAIPLAEQQAAVAKLQREIIKSQSRHGRD